VWVRAAALRLSAWKAQPSKPHDRGESHHRGAKCPRPPPAAGTRDKCHVTPPKPAALLARSAAGPETVMGGREEERGGGGGAFTSKASTHAKKI
jgi:hypothetical protein